MNIYLDHAATTPLSEGVMKTIVDNLSLYGNPSSMHRLGVASERCIKSSRRVLSEMLNINEREVIFTSGGTEANNLAIFGSVQNKSKGRYITSQIEHPSVIKAFEALERLGNDVIYSPVNSDGYVDVDFLKESLTIDTYLVSIMYVNNEVGSIQPIEEIGKVIFDFNKANKANVRFHVDAVQAFGKLNINFEKNHIDLMSISAHKINGPKGVGALICRSSVILKPIFHGGQQESGVRPGTENLLGIIAFGEAAKEANENMSAHYDRVQLLKSHMIDQLTQHHENVLNGLNTPLSSPYILNVSFVGIKAEVLLHSLEMENVYVATGSACSSKKKSQSHVLKALKYREKRIEGAIRISFGKETTLEQVDEAAGIILKSASELRQIMSKKRR